MTEEKLISLEKFIEEAAKRGVNFGKGDPYNRLRYYTKLGWLPHMQRKRLNNEIVAHYPHYALDLLIEIEKLKSIGLSKDEIAKKISAIKDTRKTNLIKAFAALTPTKKTFVKIGVFFLFLLLLAGLGLLPIGKSQNDMLRKTLNMDQRILLDSGSSYLPKGQSKIFVKSSNVKTNSKINVSFNGDYFPATRYWVSEKISFEGFYIQVDSPVNNDTEFSWWVSD